MALKRAIMMSFLAHGALLVSLLAGRGCAMLPKNKPSMPIEAHLVVKNKRKDLLPKKAKAPSEKIELKQEPLTQKQVLKETKPLVGDKQAKTATKSNDSYMKALSSLSKNFADDIAAKEEPIVDPVYEGDANDSYFDQIYSQIKASFVVPPHLNGPKGHSLKISVRIFLAFNGDLIKVLVAAPSQDEQFDKAVIEGIKRVNSFGEVPIYLQSSLRTEGILVDLCPFTCTDS